MARLVWGQGSPGGAALIIQGHVLDVLAGMEPESVSCVVTSPPSERNQTR